MPIIEKGTTDARKQVIKQLLRENGGVYDDLAELVTDPDDSVGAYQLKDDLEEYSFVGFCGCASPHPLHDLMGDIYINDNFPAEGLLIYHEDDNRIPLFVMIYLDEENRLRAYVPTSGNAFNPETGKPYGEGGIYDGLPEGENDLNLYDDTAAKNFGFSSYADMLSKMPDAYPYLYDKQQLLAEISEAFKIEPQRRND